MLLAFALTAVFSFMGCDVNSENTDKPATETTQENTGGGTIDDSVTGGDEGSTDEEDKGNENKRTPVTPIVNGGNINKS